ncbi:MAG: tandem-95 repeat protein [Pelagimonas sp.]
MPAPIFSPSADFSAQVDLNANTLPVNGTFSDLLSVGGWVVSGLGSGISGQALSLSSGGTAQVGIGVLPDGDTLTVVMDVTAGMTPALPASVALLVGGVVVGTQDLPSGAQTGVLFDLEALDLSAHTVGQSPVELRLINGTGAPWTIDNVVVEGGYDPVARGQGSLAFTDADLGATHSVSAAFQGVTGPSDIVSAGEASGLLSLSVEGGKVNWSFEASKAVLAKLEQGETLTLNYAVTLQDNAGLSTTDVLSIVLTGTNEAPVVQDGAHTLDEDASIVGQIVVTDPDDTTFDFKVEQPPAHGTVVLDAATGSYTYTPHGNYSGSDQFTFSVTDGDGARREGTVALTVTPVNDAPILLTPALAAVQPLDASEGFDLRLASLSFVDADAGDEDLTLRIVGAVGAGELEFDAAILSVLNLVGDAAAGTITGSQSNLNTLFSRLNAIRYVDLTGTDVTLTLFIDDNGATGGAAHNVQLGQISVAVNADPEATDSVKNGTEDTVILGQLTATDPDGDTLTYSLVPGQGVSNGTLVLNSDGSYSYTPYPNYAGTDSFQYRASDGSVTDTAEVTLIISAEDDAPILRNEHITVAEDGTLEGELDGLALNAGEITFAIAPGGAPQHGTLILKANGDYTYTPHADYFGNDSFTFVATNAGLSSFATGIVTVTARPDAPTLTDPGTLTLEEDDLVSGTLQAQDPDGDALVFSLAEGGAPEHGVLLLDEDGLYTYTPGANYFGADSFTVEVSDGTHTTTRVISVNVTPVNDAPTTEDLTVSGDEDTTVTGQIVADDVDSDLSYSLAADDAPTNGMVTLAADGSFSYVPATDFNGQDSFTVVVSDGEFEVRSVVTVNVAPVNDAPVANDDSYVIDEDTVGVFAVAANDSDVDVTDVLGAVSVGAASHGDVTVDAHGRVIYTPNADYFGEDSFTYTVGDGQGGTATATVHVTVNPKGEFDAPATDPGAPGDDVFDISGSSGRTARFDGGAGVDTVRNTQAGGVFDLTDAEFVGIERIVGFYGLMTVTGGGRLDLSSVAQIINLRGIRGSDLADEIIGSQDNDVITGGKGADHLSGGQGDDSFLLDVGDAAGDTIDGGAGFDRVRASYLASHLDLSGARFSSIEEVDAGGAAITTGSAAVLDLSGVDQVVNTTGLRGSDAADEITGSQGADVIVGGFTATLASGAEVTLNIDGTYSYDPGNHFAHIGAGETTTDSFTYTVTDTHGATSQATTTITLTGDNETPTDAD